MDRRRRGAAAIARLGAAAYGVLASASEILRLTRARDIVIGQVIIRDMEMIKDPWRQLEHDWLLIYYAIVVLVIYSVLSVNQPPDERLLFCGLILIWLPIDQTRREMIFAEEHYQIKFREEMLSLKRLIRQTSKTPASPEEEAAEMQIANSISQYKGEEAHRYRKMKISTIYQLCAYGLTLWALFFTIWPVVFGPLVDGFLHAFGVS